MSHLEAKADQAIIPMSSHWKKKEEYMPITTETATRVYVKKENPTGLLQAYTGPDKIVERPGIQLSRLEWVPSRPELRIFM